MSRVKSLYKPFQSWQQLGNIWIFSDPHWEDEDCKLMDENWVTPREHVKLLNKVKKQDTIVCLGDVGNPEYMKYIRARHKVLVKGNHDTGSSNYEPYFDEVYSGAVMISPQIILSHEPIYLPFALNIHGHDHSAKTIWDLNDKNEIIGVNLASNVCNYTPFNLNDYVNNGGLKKILTIHRIAIEKQKAGDMIGN